MTDSLTAETIKAILYEKLVMQSAFSDHRVMFAEFIPGTGSSRGNESRIDAWMMDLWPSNHLERIAFEIKVSRSDFLSELKKPAKRRYAVQFSNSFYFVAPKGLIRPAELPTEAGLMEVSDGDLHTTVKAPFRDTVLPTWALVAAICRRAVRKQMDRGCLFCGERLQPAPNRRGWFSTGDGNGIHFDCAERLGELGHAIKNAKTLTIDPPKDLLSLGEQQTP